MTTTTRARYFDGIFSRAFLESCKTPPLRLWTGAFSDVANSRREARLTQLHQIKRRMLRAALESTLNPGLFKPLSGAANVAAELAWETEYPLLLFPCLFEELAQKVRGQAATMPPG